MDSTPNSQGRLIAAFGSEKSFILTNKKINNSNYLIIPKQVIPLYLRINIKNIINMNLYEELGESLNPKGWPSFAPPYFSPEGWEFQKDQATQRLNFVLKDERASAMIDRASEVGNACLEAHDNEKAKKYISIMEKLIQYRVGLRNRYPLAQ